MDFAKGRASSISDDVIQGTDGTLIAEFRLAERLHRQNVLSNTYETVTCAASNGVSFHQCADVAGAATIAEDEASKWQIEAEDVYYGDLSGHLDSSNAQPFGVACGSDRVGDGVVNTFDIAVFAFAMFNRAPYNVALTTQTVVMRSDLTPQCGNQTTRGDWQAKLSTSFCPVGAGRRRRLAESEAVSDHVDFWEHARIEGGVQGSGTWYEISINGIQSVVEIMMDGIWAEYPVSLVNEPYPREEDPHTHRPADLNKIELRWARKLEFKNMPTSSCSAIVNGISGTIAMEGDTIGVRQEGAMNELLCAFVIFIYIPDGAQSAQQARQRRLSSSSSTSVPVRVVSGSTWRYPQKGYILETDTAYVRSDDFFVSGTNTTSSPPPPPDGDSSSNSAIRWLLIALCVLLIGVLCVLCWCWCIGMGEKREEEEEEKKRRQMQNGVYIGNVVGNPLRNEHVPLLKINGRV